MPLIVLLGAGCGGPTPDLSALTWMEGCWASETPEFTLEECWLRDGEALQGRGTMDDRVYETAVIAPTANGPQYLVRKATGSQVTFAVTEASATAARFENPDHDSPKWIEYARDGQAMVARTGNGSTAEQEWRFIKR